MDSSENIYEAIYFILECYFTNQHGCHTGLESRAIPFLIQIIITARKRSLREGNVFTCLVELHEFTSLCYSWGRGRRRLSSAVESRATGISDSGFLQEIRITRSSSRSQRLKHTRQVHGFLLTTRSWLLRTISSNKLMNIRGGILATTTSPIPRSNSDSMLFQ